MTIHQPIRASDPAWLREIGQLRPDNHELWKYLQRCVLDPVPVAEIAAELGLDVDSLVAWMLSYRGPKRKPYQSKSGPPIGKVRAHMPSALAATPSLPSGAIASVRFSISDEERRQRSEQATRYGRWRGKPETARQAAKAGRR